ncbi:MAG: 16S rRNA (guanine(966)-N(2))-methyltransferase RsmD [Lautropia sp.]|nr:16S rRNA (guanine(966)-N(2))-methyltransferase RsmD [Lautropia sp.]
MASQIRIIGGQWKRSVLPVPAHQGLRPTPDRVRETLFNWLGQSLPGWRCLDLFAGTGALGLEAASRGAASVLLVECDPGVVRHLQNSVRRLKADAVVQVVRADARIWLDRTPPAPQDLVFLDPPFRVGWLARILPAVMPWLAPGGVIYVEADIELTPGWLAEHGLTDIGIIRAGRAGQVHYHLLSRNSVD